MKDLAGAPEHRGRLKTLFARILQLGVNEPAKDTTAKSKEKQFPDLDEESTATNKQRDNWRFFAVTYDSGLADGHVKIYVGNSGWNGKAKLVSTLDYDRGPVGRKISPSLTIGNLSVIARQRSRDRSFPGLIDEIKIFGQFMIHGGVDIESLVRCPEEVETGLIEIESIGRRKIVEIITKCIIRVEHRNVPAPIRKPTVIQHAVVERNIKRTTSSGSSLSRSTRWAADTISETAKGRAEE